MKLIEPLIVALGMYSKIPVPQIEWNKDNMRLALLYFPVAGLACGAGIAAWSFIASFLPVGSFFRSVVFVLIPILISGGIHMDGFMDTMDAVSSWGDREKKLEILKDSHSGAFAILFCCLYLLTAVAVWTEITEFYQALILGFSMAYSRALSGYGIARFRSARKNGLVSTFNAMADQKKAGFILMIEAVVFAAIMIVINVPCGIAAAATGFLVFVIYRSLSYKTFGGITGDLAGCFLVMAELLMALGVMITGKIM